MQPDNGSQLAQVIISLLSLVLTVGAAFLGAWLTYLFQGKKDREQLETRIMGNLKLLGDDLMTMSTRLARMDGILETMKKHYLSTGQIPVPTFYFPRESLLQVKYDITFLCHHASLTGPLSDLIALLDNLTASVANVSEVLKGKGAEISRESFLESRAAALRLPLDHSESANKIIGTLQDEVKRMNDRLTHNGSFFSR